MAKKKVVVVKNTRISKLAAVTEQLATLRATIQEYFRKLRFRSAEPHQYAMNATVVGVDGVKRDGQFNVSSLIATVMTARGLGKEVRLEAEQNAQGGTLYVRFYSPVNVDGVDMLA